MTLNYWYRLMFSNKDLMNVATRRYVFVLCTLCPMTMIVYSDCEGLDEVTGPARSKVPYSYLPSAARATTGRSGPGRDRDEVWERVECARGMRHTTNHAAVLA
jgi:hypothetical protein